MPLPRRLTLRSVSVGARLLLINGLSLLAVGIVSVIAWSALDEQRQAMDSLALISKAARYHQDVDMLHATLRADVNGARAGFGIDGADLKASLQTPDDTAADMRRDLQALEHFHLPADLLEAEQKVRRLADTFMLRALEIGRLALRDRREALPLVPAYNKSIQALDVALEAQKVLLTQRVVRANDDATAAHVD